MRCDVPGVCLSCWLLAVSGKDCLLHFPWWKIHLGDVVTNILCIQALYQILRTKKGGVVVLVVGLLCIMLKSVSKRVCRKTVFNPDM